MSYQNRKNILNLLTVIVFTATLIGCSSDSDKFSSMTLSSGRVIRARRFWVAVVPGGRHILHLDYETDLNLSLDDKAQLRREADEIWPTLKSEAEKRNYDIAMNTPYEKRRGFVILPNFYFFVYKRQPDGSWLRFENQKRPLGDQ